MRQIQRNHARTAPSRPVSRVEPFGRRGTPSDRAWLSVGRFGGSREAYGKGGIEGDEVNGESRATAGVAAH